MTFGSRHTMALRYSRLERLHFRIFKRWPRAVVERRLDAANADQLEAEQARAVRRFAESGPPPKRAA